MAEKIELTFEEFEVLAGYAVRYSIGRTTYAPSEVCRIIAPRVSLLSPKGRHVMRQDIIEAAACGQLGREVDAREWGTLLGLLQESDDG